MNVEVIQRIKPYVPPAVRRALNHSIRRPARRLAERAVQREVQATMDAAGLSPITDIGPDDVVIVGYPKSGTTWFRLMVAGVVYGVDLSLSPPAFLNRLVPDPHSEKGRYYRRFQTPMLFKSHFLPRPEYRRVVYVERDGRDVMVSLLHHLRREGTIDDSVDLLQLMRTPEWHFPCEWHTHVEAWDANPYRAEKITIRYEDLLQDPVRELGRFCEFAGVERDRELLATVTEQGTFERLQQKERTVREHPGRDMPGDELFFRRGQAGSYRDEMPPDALAAFLEHAGPTLRKCGYPVDTQGLHETRSVGL
jgi:hypothetical protein